jgi:hypothetical protein
MTKPLRPIAMIAEELAAAERMSESTRDVPRDDPLVQSMLSANDDEIVRLRSELMDARSSDIEVSITGRPVVAHRVSASYLARMVNDLQGAYRAVAENISTTAKPSRSVTALTVAGTAPGSFRVRFRTADEALSLLERPLSERTLETVFSVIGEAVRADLSHRVRAWASSASEPSVRAIIRLAATLASSQGTAQFRWTPPGGNDRVVAVSAHQARSLAAALAGAVGREILTVQGHLGMAQDDPPRVRISTSTDDEHVASVRDDELLLVVRDLLFRDVVAEIVVDMATSPTTGAPSIRSELLSLKAVDDDL